MQLRPYQQEAKEAVQGEWAGGVKRTLLVQATGTGKTIVFSSISEDCVRDGERVLIPSPGSTNRPLRSYRRPPAWGVLEKAGTPVWT